MDIELIRDIVIIVSGVIFTIVLLVIVLVVLSLSRKIKEITKNATVVMEKVQHAADDVQVITSYARQEVAMPLVQLAGFIQGLGQGLQSLTQMFKKWY